MATRTPVLNPEPLLRVAEGLAAQLELTAREKVVAVLWMDGWSVDEIGAAMGIKRGTVGSHVFNIKGKAMKRGARVARRLSWLPRVPAGLADVMINGVDGNAGGVS